MRIGFAITFDRIKRCSLKRNTNAYHSIVFLIYRNSGFAAEQRNSLRNRMWRKRYEAITIVGVAEIEIAIDAWTPVLYLQKQHSFVASDIHARIVAERMSTHIAEALSHNLK